MLLSHPGRLGGGGGASAPSPSPGTQQGSRSSSLVFAGAKGGSELEGGSELVPRDGLCPGCSRRWQLSRGGGELPSLIWGTALPFPCELGGFLTLCFFFCPNFLMIHF